ncbi:unnamed protein product, partial [Meganyctiphanes norvegica]
MAAATSKFADVKLLQYLSKDHSIMLRKYKENNLFNTSRFQMRFQFVNKAATCDSTDDRTFPLLLRKRNDISAQRVFTKIYKINKSSTNESAIIRHSTHVHAKVKFNDAAVRIRGCFFGKRVNFDKLLKKKIVNKAPQK